MDTVQGVVETTWGEGKEFKFKIDGIYYSNKFKKSPNIRKGDVVAVKFENNPEYKNQFWKSVTVVEEGDTTSVSTPTSTPASPKGKAYSAFPVAYNSDKRAIIRQNSLTNAVNFGISNITFTGDESKIDEMVDKIIRIAMKFEEYSSGDLDVKVKEEMDENGISVE